MTKHNGNQGGRPTKLNREMIVKLNSLVDKWNPDFKDSKQALVEFFCFCGLDQVAGALGIYRDKIRDYKKKSGKFRIAIDNWETKRNDFFLRLAPFCRPAIWIFLSKNFLHYTDRVEIQTGDHEEALDRLRDIKLGFNRSAENIMKELKKGNKTGREPEPVIDVEPEPVYNDGKDKKRY